jgi:hypothetical protein
MKLLAVLAIASASLGAAAVASPFDDLYANTVTSTSPTGRTIIYYFNPDGTFENHFPSGKVFKGAYIWRDGRTACFTITDPPPAAGESTTNCREFPVTHHVGDTWTEVDAEGVTWTNNVIPGR